MKYFEHFPVITYQGVRVKDITRRAEFIKSVSNNPYLHLPYTVKENERPQDIALDYYGSVDYDWLVLLANNIIDPYYQWPLSDKDFKNYLIEKYKVQSGEEGDAVIDWLKDTTTEDNVVYYYRPL